MHHLKDPLRRLDVIETDVSASQRALLLRKRIAVGEHYREESGDLSNGERLFTVMPRAYIFLKTVQFQKRTYGPCSGLNFMLIRLFITLINRVKSRDNRNGYTYTHGFFLKIKQLKNTRCENLCLSSCACRKSVSRYDNPYKMSFSRDSSPP